MAWGLNTDTTGPLQCMWDTAGPRGTSNDLGESWGKDGKVKRICTFSYTPFSNSFLKELNDKKLLL